jgi:outer membrane protein OmpA-like peptidoglycan-associated protein
MSFTKSKIAVLALMLVVILVLLPGCATKKYVKQQIDPISGKIDELTQISKKNESAIKDVDSRAQAGIQTVQTKANEVDQKAMAANQKAEQAQQMGQKNQVQITTVENTFNQKFANLDNYKAVDKVTMNFDFNKSKLSDATKASLDQLASKVKGDKGYALEIQGFTDSKGSESYNLALSQKRAEAVVRYLTEQGVPLFRTAIVGFGAAKEVEPNKTKEGRAANRRVEVTLLKMEK